MMLLIAILLFPITAFVNGLALKVLWGWFIVDAFNAPPLTVPLALGFALIVGFLTARVDVMALGKSDERSESEKKAGFVVAVAVSIGRPLLVLGFGYIYKMFM